MKRKRLRIGASACYFHADPKRAIFKGKSLLYLEQSMAHWAQSEGALVYMIPDVGPRSQVSLKDLAGELDGLLLQGGSDVSPKSYGEEPLKPEWSGDAVRDQYEIALVREFQAAGKPILGICRGAQLINVAFGGTLYQDIGTQIPGALVHRDWEIYDQNFHEVRFEPGSLLGRIYGESASGNPSHRVNSVHHQSIKKPGKGVIVDAVSPKDGVIEAIRLDGGASWIFAVQWHPEFHDPNDPSLLDGAPILKKFMEEARNA